MNKRITRIVVTVVVVLLVLLICISLTTSGPNKTKHTNYTARSKEFIVVNPSSLRVFAEVKNVGNDSGIPTCNFSAHDQSYSYTGVDVVTKPSQLNAGDSWNFAIELGVSKDGAQYIRSVDVTCQ